MPHSFFSLTFLSAKNQSSIWFCIFSQQSEIRKFVLFLLSHSALYIPHGSDKTHMYLEEPFWFFDCSGFYIGFLCLFFFGVINKRQFPFFHKNFSWFFSNIELDIFTVSVELCKEVRDILVEQGMDPAAYDMAVGNILAAAKGNVELVNALQDYLVLIEKANSQGVKR